ncbi:MAG: NAD-dependent epimerase/dehydratase family protein [Nanoarchaeota archaeon]|nr:NAD-dependent epimerase/dehydratase family protein [Nanoarchaeota archaeon]
MTKEKILVIGGTGFLGSRIADYLEREDYEISILSRDVNKQNKGYNSYTCDIAGGGITLEEAIEESDVVIHCAGKVSYNPKEKDILYKLHVDGTVNIVDICLRLNKKLIYTSSAAVLGISNNPYGNVEEQLPQIEEIKRIKSAYFTTKYIAEEIVKKSGLDAIILRPSSLIGHGKTSTTRLLGFLKKGFEPYFGGGASFVYVDDVARAYVKALKRITNPDRKKQDKVEIYNLGGHNLTFNQLIKEAKKELGTRKIIRIPKIVNNLAPLVIPSLITGESLRIMDYCFFVNSNKAQEDLNYRLTPITEALKETVKEL